MAMTWRPPADLAQRLRIVTALTGRSANAIINEAVSDWLTQNEPPEAAALQRSLGSAKDRPDANS